MTITIQLNKAPTTSRSIEKPSSRWSARATAIGDHTVDGHARAAASATKLEALRCATRAQAVEGSEEPGDVRAAACRALRRRRSPDRVAAVLARRELLVAATRSSAGLPEMKTGVRQDRQRRVPKYLNDRTRAPLGRRYFIVTEAGRATSVQVAAADPARARHVRGDRHDVEQVLDDVVRSCDRAGRCRSRSTSRTSSTASSPTSRAGRRSPTFGLPPRRLRRGPARSRQRRPDAARPTTASSISASPIRRWKAAKTYLAHVEGTIGARSAGKAPRRCHARRTA